MVELFDKLKKMIAEPKVYALMVRSDRGSVLHLGVHFSLEEAYAAARTRMQSIATHKVGEAMDIDLWNCMPARECIVNFFDPSKQVSKLEELSIDPPNTNDVGPKMLPNNRPQGQHRLVEALMALNGPLESLIPLTSYEQPPMTLKDYFLDAKDAKNDLMQRLADIGGVSDVVKFGKVLTNNDRKYILRRIADRGSIKIEE